MECHSGREAVDVDGLIGAGGADAERLADNQHIEREPVDADYLVVDEDVVIAARVGALVGENSFDSLIWGERVNHRRTPPPKEFSCPV